MRSSPCWLVCHVMLELAQHSCCCHAESAASPLSAPAADDKTRLVRSQLLQDGASDVQPPSAPAPSAAVPSSSIVQGQGAPEPKPAVPAPADVPQPASAQSAESRPAQPPSAQPPASSSAPAPLKESGEDPPRLPVTCGLTACCRASQGLSIAGVQCIGEMRYEGVMPLQVLQRMAASQSGRKRRRRKQGSCWTRRRSAARHAAERRCAL